MELLSRDFGDFCKDNGYKVVTAESCTAGLIGATIAMTPGSSQWLDRGFIVYTPESKNEMLDVNFKTIEDYDITSTEVAKEMALGALAHSEANLAFAVTGLAGPGGTKEIPGGTVCMAWAVRGKENEILLEKKLFSGPRNIIREDVVKHILVKAMLELKNIPQKKNKFSV